MFGIKGCSLREFFSPVLVALVIGVILQLAMYFIFPSFLGKSVGPTEQYSFIQIVLFVWIIASLAEEILFRGLIQGMLSPMNMQHITLGGLAISYPALISGILFGIVHLCLISTGLDIKYVLGIVVSAVIVGVTSGYFREKTGSVWPAFMTHMVFNITGFGIESLLKLLTK